MTITTNPLTDLKGKKMARFKLEDIPTADLQAMGLHDGKDLLLDEKTKSALLNGNLTNFVRLNDINISGNKVSIDAKLSLRSKENGTVGLFIHPIYKERSAHPNLTPDEATTYSTGGPHAKANSAYGTIKSFGSAPYQFNEKNKESFFVELEKDNGKSVQIWSKDLQRALLESKHQVGDKVQLFHHGIENVMVDVPKYNDKNEVIGTESKMTHRNNWEIKDYEETRKQEKFVVYEFDKDTNSFVSVDAENITAPEEINGIPLTPEQKREFKNGNAVVLSDGTEIQASPASDKGIRSNKKLLVASILLDGGLSFVLYHGITALLKLGKEQKQKETEYSKGYADALKKVQIDLERKSAQFPNDKSITDDLNLVKKESARFTASTDASQTVDNKEPSINETKAKVNDPELLRNASDRDEEKQESYKEEREQTEQVHTTRTVTEDEEQEQSQGRKR